MPTRATERLYLHDEYCFESEAVVMAVSGDCVAFDRTCFYPGGGGQPSDSGTAYLGGTETAIASIRADGDVLWHVAESAFEEAAVGQTATLTLDVPRRLSLMRYHTVLHVLNTIALRDHGAWITGVQMAQDYSRIDFKIENFSQALGSEIERKVNDVLSARRSLRSYYITAEEFEKRADLLRTLDVKPPVIDGRVRVVEIEGFDAQACGGTHVHTTAEVGALSIFRVENKGKNNKRLYLRLDSVERLD
jgi:misacylated tRNA(Ala) deacylase